MTTTDKKTSVTDWGNVPFIDYLNEVDKLLEAQFGITSTDCDLARIADCQEAGDTPEQCIQWIGQKFDLKSIPATTARTEKIARLNDQFRTTFIGGKVMTTQGIETLTIDQKMAVLARVRQFNDFNPDNDPHKERDFGAFALPDVGKVYFKMDYYDKAMEYGSEDPANPEVTTRVLTIMLAEEY